MAKNFFSLIESLKSSFNKFLRTEERKLVPNLTNWEFLSCNEDRFLTIKHRWSKNMSFEGVFLLYSE